MSVFDIAACPWCRGVATLNGNLRPMYVECAKLNCCCGPSADTPEEAVAKWNFLSGRLAKLHELVDLLEEALCELSVVKAGMSSDPDERRRVIFDDPLLNKLRCVIYEARANG